MPVHHASDTFYKRLSQITERATTLTELSINGTGHSCRSGIRLYLSQHPPPEQGSGTSRLSIIIGTKDNPPAVCSLVEGDNIDDRLGRRLRRSIDKDLMEGKDIEQAITNMLRSLDIMVPSKTVLKLRMPEVVKVPVWTVPQYQAAPPIVAKTPALRAPSAPTRTEGRLVSWWSIYFAGVLLLVVGTAFGIIRYRMWHKPRKKLPSRSSSPTLLTSEISDEELLNKSGFGGIDLTRMASDGTYEKIFRERLFRAGIRLHLLCNLAEIAEERYPELWHGTYKRLSAARKHMAREIDLRHVEVASNRENRSLRERILNVCRGLEIASTECNLIFEAYEQDLENRFKVYALLRAFYAEAKNFRAFAYQAPAERLGLLQALDHYDDLSHRIMKNEMLTSWSEVYFELVAAKTEVEELAKSMKPPSANAVPTVIAREPSTRRLATVSDNNLSEHSMGELLTFVPGQ